MNTLCGGYRHAILWQSNPEDWAAEAAIEIRTYANDVISLRSGDAVIIINRGSVKELIKMLKAFADEPYE
jgi:hypothetical protein